MDDDGSKTLDFREFRDGLYDFGLRELDDQTIADVFQELDKDGSGKLSYDEFLVAIRVYRSYTFSKCASDSQYICNIRRKQTTKHLLQSLIKSTVFMPIRIST
jgi:Ca2+-binding EF-hand superfamily protein